MSEEAQLVEMIKWSQNSEAELVDHQMVSELRVQLRSTAC